MTPIEATNFIAGLAQERIAAMSDTPTTQATMGSEADTAMAVLQAHFEAISKEGAHGSDPDN